MCRSIGSCVPVLSSVFHRIAVELVMLVWFLNDNPLRSQFGQEICRTSLDGYASLSTMLIKTHAVCRALAWRSCYESNSGCDFTDT